MPRQARKALQPRLCGASDTVWAKDLGKKGRWRLALANKCKTTKLQRAMSGQLPPQAFNLLPGPASLGEQRREMGVQLS